MKDLILFTKTYKRDIERFQKLYDSVQKYNVDDIPYYGSVPENDLVEFENRFPNVEWMKDTDIVLTPPDIVGWVQQQFVKLFFYRRQIAEHYIVLDSDAEFIHDFRKKYFLSDDGIPKYVMQTNRDMFEWYEDKGKHILPFDPRRSHFRDYDIIHETMQVNGETFHYSFPYMFSSRVIDFLDHNIGIEEAIKMVPCELNWHGVSIRKLDEIDPDFKYERIPKSLFKIYHYEQQYKDQYISDQDLRDEGYIGKVIQSNWAK